MVVILAFPPVLLSAKIDRTAALVVMVALPAVLEFMNSAPAARLALPALLESKNSTFEEKMALPAVLLFLKKIWPGPKIGALEELLMMPEPLMLKIGPLRNVKE